MNDNRISAFLTSNPIWVLQCHKVKKKKEKRKRTHLSYLLSCQPEQKQYRTDFSCPAYTRTYNYRAMDKEKM
jgi:hypothetical protein